MIQLVVTLLLFLRGINPGSAHVALPKWFGDHMVLQTTQENGAYPSLSGKGEAGETIQVTVLGSIGNEDHYTTTVDPSRDWKIRLNDHAAWYHKENISIEVTGTESTNKVVANQVKFGDVFFCSGQSNMVFPLNVAFDPEKEVDTLRSFPNFNFFVTERGYADQPEWDLPTEEGEDCDIDGKVDGKHGCNRWVTQQEALMTIPDAKIAKYNQYILQFSALCFMTVRDMAKMHDSIGSTRPVGIVQSAWKGARVEAYMSPEAIESTPFADQIPDRHSDPNQGHQTSVLYNAMLHPWNNYAVRAVLWDQGEANAMQIVEGEVTDPNYYTTMYQAMIDDLRHKKGIGYFAWGTVQLPPSIASNAPSDEQLGTGRMPLRLAQQDATRGTENSALVVTLDLGGASLWHYNHQPNKNEMARRLASSVLHVAYDQQDLPWTGPILQSLTAESDTKIVIDFDEVGSGLNLRDVKGANIDGTRNDCIRCCAEQPPFEVQIDNEEWKLVSRGDISIQDNSIALDVSNLASGMDAVTSVRYAWSDFVDCVVENSDGLVAGPFVEKIASSSNQRQRLRRRL